jgi:hypothetical protein
MSSTIDCLSLSMAVVAGSVRFQPDLSDPDAFAMPSGGRRCTASTVSLDTILFVALRAEEPGEKSKVVARSPSHRRC